MFKTVVFLSILPDERLSITQVSGGYHIMQVSGVRIMQVLIERQV
jgi:hypothetical protein